MRLSTLALASALVSFAIASACSSSDSGSSNTGGSSSGGTSASGGGNSGGTNAGGTGGTGTGGSNSDGSVGGQAGNGTNDDSGPDTAVCGPLGIGSSACDACLAASCCDVWKACGADTDCTAVVQCLQTDGGSPDTCAPDGGGSAFEAVSTCVASNCSNDCH